MQILLNGLVSGLTLAMLALAFALVYLPCRVFHIALGGVYAITPYLAMALLGHHLPWSLVAAASVSGAVLIAIGCEVGNHRRLDRRQASASAHLIASLGIYILLVQAIAIIWGNETQVLRAGIDATFRIGSVVLTHTQVISACVSLLLLAACYLWLLFSSLGLRLRAMADNPSEFALLGHNVHRYRLLAFGLSGLLAGTAALLNAYDVGFDPHGGLHMLLLAIIAMIVGGRASFLGPAVGALLLGVIRSEVVWHLSARWQDVLAFVLLAVFLYARPNGILSRQGRLEAEA